MVSPPEYFSDPAVIQEEACRKTQGDGQILRLGDARKEPQDEKWPQVLSRNPVLF
jgi:hypothetical protein